MSDSNTDRKYVISANIILDSEDAEQNPQIREFVEHVSPEVSGGCVPFHFLQSKEVMPYWDRIVITRFDEKIGDYRYIFVGTTVVDAYGGDFTGAITCSHPDELVGDSILRTIRNEVIETREPKYYSGTVIRKDYHEKYWDTVCMPYVYSLNEPPAGTVNLLAYRR